MGKSIFSDADLSWISWVLKYYELDFTGLAGFNKNKGRFRQGFLDF